MSFLCAGRKRAKKGTILVRMGEREQNEVVRKLCVPKVEIRFSQLKDGHARAMDAL